MKCSVYICLLYTSIETLKAEHPQLEVIVVNDTSDQITSALKSVTTTMVMAVIISMIIIFLFFGDIKASLIVGDVYKRQR